MPIATKSGIGGGTSVQTISKILADFAVGLRFEDVPEDVRMLAQLVLLDTVGCALAGSTTEEARLVREVVRAVGGDGDAQIWGTDQRAPFPMAALANGTAAHAREIDDFGGCAHSGAVIIPAALGTAIRAGATGRELLTAIVIGYDVARRVMDGGGGYLPFKARGWHSTSVCGGFGAAAAVGRLLKLDPKRMQSALGFAGSNAGGTWAFIPDGAMSKRLHPGFASQSGVVSAYLAASGVTSPTSIFETDWGGFYSTYIGDKSQIDKAVQGLGTDFRIRLVGFKPYATCRGIQSSVDVILALRAEEGLRPNDVARVTVRGSQTHKKQLSKQDVETVLDAQFSLPYSIAVALETGGAMLNQFTPEMIRRPGILALTRRIEVVADSAVPDGAEPFLDVELTDGRVLTRRVMIARGDCENPLTKDELHSKFRTASGLALGREQVGKLEQAITRITDAEKLDEFADLLKSSDELPGQEGWRTR